MKELIELNIRKGTRYLGIETPKFMHGEYQEKYHAIEKDGGIVYYDVDTMEINYTYNIDLGFYTVLSEDGS